jgi:hypothetical protein
LQAFLEEVLDSAVEGTGITRVSLMTRLEFDYEDDVTSGVFTKTDDEVILQPAYLPSLDTLVVWVGDPISISSSCKQYPIVL